MSESLTVEFKSDKKKYPDAEIFDAVVAFANTEGGNLYLGVEDDGEIMGAHKEHTNPVTLSAYTVTGLLLIGKAATLLENIGKPDSEPLYYRRRVRTGWIL